MAKIGGTKMLLSEINTNFETHKVLQYGSDGNKVVKHNVDMQLIKGNLYKGENIKNSGCGYETCELFMFYPEYNIGIEVNSVATDTEVEQVIASYENSIFVSTEKFISCMDSLAENGLFIGAIHIELTKYIKPENVSKYQEAKIKFHRKKDLEYQQKQKEKEENEQKYCDEQNKIAENKVKEVIEALKKDGEINNVSITFYKSEYTNHSLSVINYIAKLYNVKIPLKVQGWINEHLMTIYIKDGKLEKYSYHMGHKSTTIFKYIDMLINTIRSGVNSEQV